MRSEIETFLEDSPQEVLDGDFNGVIPNLGLTSKQANKPVPLLGLLISGLFHLTWVGVLMLLVAPFGRGRYQSITIEMGLSETADHSSTNMLDLTPLMEEAPALESVAAEDAILKELLDSQSEIKLEQLDRNSKAESQSVAGDSATAGDQTAQKDGKADAAPGQSGTFFGTQAHGDKFVYVIDMSSSMRATVSGKQKTRLRVAEEEVVRSINNLTADQEFYVILFATETRPMFDQTFVRMLPATTENKVKLADWLLNVDNSRGTDPRAALRTALKLKPSAVFLLSDGQFNNQASNGRLFTGNPSVEDIVRDNRQPGTPIHSIALDFDREPRMAALAESTGGSYRYVQSAAKLGEFAQRVRFQTATANPLDAPMRMPVGNLQEDQARKLYRSASALWTQGDKNLAMTRLREVVRRFPNTKAAKTAQQVLDRVKMAR